MKRTLPLLAVAALVTAMPPVAQARRAPRPFEREQLAAAAEVPMRCGIFWVSTVNRRYASFEFNGRPRGCLPWASNGQTVYRRSGPYWKPVLAGSSIPCPIRGVPARVARDLRIRCYHR